MHDLMTLTARVGRKSFPVKSWEQVSQAYRKTIETLNLGASAAPQCTIHKADGTIYARVSYNGKVWLGAEWASGQKPVYDPYA